MVSKELNQTGATIRTPHFKQNKMKTELEILRKSNAELLDALIEINKLLKPNNQIELACKTIAAKAINNATK